MKNILIFAFLPFFIFGFSFLNFENNFDFSENNSEIIAETEEKIFKNLKEEKDFYVYNYENISIKIKKSEIFDINENTFEKVDLQVFDSRNNNNFYFNIWEYENHEVKNLDEFTAFLKENIERLLKVKNVKLEKVEKFWKNFQRLTYSAWWAEMQEYFLSRDEKTYIQFRIAIFDEAKEFEKEIFEIFESIEFKK